MELKRKMDINEVKILKNYVYQGDSIFNFSLNEGPYQSELFFDKEALKKYGMENINDIIDNRILLTLESLDLELVEPGKRSKDMLLIKDLKKVCCTQRESFSNDVSKKTDYSALFESYRTVSITGGIGKSWYNINLKLDELEYHSMMSFKPKTAMKANFQII